MEIFKAVVTIIAVAFAGAWIFSVFVTLVMNFFERTNKEK